MALLRLERKRVPDNALAHRVALNHKVPDLRQPYRDSK